MKIIFLSLVMLCVATFGISQTEDCGIVLPSMFVTEEDESGEERKLFIVELPCPAEKITVQLIDRWGKMVAEKEELEIEGSVQLDGTDLKPQTLFISVVVTINGQDQKYNGMVTLI